MFDIEKYYKKENQKAEEGYRKSLGKVKVIVEETEGVEDKYFKYFNGLGKMIIHRTDLEKRLNDKYFEQDFDVLLKENHELFAEVQPENYNKSYADPAYAVKVFGDGIGQLLSYFWAEYRQFSTNAFQHKRFLMLEAIEVFVKAYELVKSGKRDYETLLEVMTTIDRSDKTERMARGIRNNFSPDYKFKRDIVESSDLSDLRYLFRYGKYITDNEIRTAKFLLDYPEEKIIKMAKLVADSYVRSFEVADKDYKKRKTVSVDFALGQERLVREVFKQLCEYGFEMIECAVDTTIPNRQYGYDHKFETALYIDADLVKLLIKNHEDAVEANKDIISNCSGSIYIEKFGEKPFSPENKPENLKLSDEQSKLAKEFGIARSKAFNKYYNRGETSFCIIAFPSPEIGEKFEEIFEDTFEINMLENKKYLPIQQTIIDTLDKADYVHILGRDGNVTDLKIKMHELKNPDKETLFDNCVADCNIPLGEVYTSPKLTGTNGVLHIKETFLDGMRYDQLKLSFKDGFTSEYSCANFDDEEANNKYVEENLLFPHKSLPIGEFAIGTNTLAYVIARKHKIMNVLPVLIIEKMGPHFAIGDTCYSWEEDQKVFNEINGKEIVAKDNEKSILRKTDINEAYTNCHTDITIPYEEIGSISAVTAVGERIDILRDCRFVLPGTEELNKPFN